MSSSHERQGKILAERIEETNPKAVHVPPDLVWMVATATGDQQIIWVSSDLSPAITNPTGEVVVFTERTIIRAIRSEDDVTLTVSRRSEVQGPPRGQHATISPTRCPPGCGTWKLRQLPFSLPRGHLLCPTHRTTPDQSQDHRWIEGNCSGGACRCGPM